MTHTVVCRVRLTMAKSCIETATHRRVLSTVWGAGEHTARVRRNAAGVFERGRFRFQLGLRLEEQPVSSLLAQQIRSSATRSLVLCQWIVVASGGSGPNVRWSVAEAFGCGRIKS